MTTRIRAAEARDLNRLVQIYNYYVSETHITFDVNPFAVGSRTQWFTGFAANGPHRLYIVENDEKLLGYASSSPFKDRAAYNTSVETTIYLDRDHQGQGYGLELYGHLIEELGREPGVHRAYAGIAMPNPASVSLHEKLGFVHVASYHEVGYKLGRFWDVHWYEKDVSQ